MSGCGSIGGRVLDLGLSLGIQWSQGFGTASHRPESKWVNGSLGMWSRYFHLVTDENRLGRPRVRSARESGGRSRGDLASARRFDRSCLREAFVTGAVPW